MDLSRLLTSALDFFFVWFDSLRPSQQFFIMSGRIFMGWTSTKQGLGFNQY